MPVINRSFFVLLMFTPAGIFGFSPLSAAQTIYKCPDAKGGAVYQSHPCEGGKPAGKQWVTEHRSETPAEIYQRQAAERKVEQDRQALRARNAPAPRPVPTGTAVSRYRDADRCEAAKRNRTRTLEMVGLKRTYSLIARLDNEVQEACK